MHDQIIRYSEGRKNLGKVTNKQKSWRDFQEMLRRPVRSSETYKFYSKMPLAQKLELKQADGFFFAAPCKGGSRKKEDVGFRDILTIDVDENAEELFEELQQKSGNWLHDYEYFIQTSRSHNPDHPKFRIVILLSEGVDRHTHGPLSRIVSSYINPDMTAIDPVSHRMAQMMFKPTASKDGAFKFHANKGKALDPNKILDEFVGDWTDFSDLPFNPEREKNVRDTSQKAENPLEKEGPVGIFCRAYSISLAIETFLADEIVPADDGEAGGEPRYTPVGSTGSSGMVIYDNDTFIYSNHTSDPIAEQNVNAWDLVRLYKFNTEDEDDDTPMAKRPSWTKMMEFAKKDPGYRAQANAEKYAAILDFTEDDVEEGDFEHDRDSIDVEEDDSEDVQTDDINDLYDDEIDAGDSSTQESSKKVDKKKKKKTKAADDGIEYDPDWFGNLDFDKTEGLKSTLSNVRKIIRNDKRLKRKFGYNEFLAVPVLKTTIRTQLPDLADFVCRKPKRGGDTLTDRLDDTIRAMLSEKGGYNINVTDRDIKSGVMLSALERPFHPIRDMFSRFADEWDGVERLHTVAHRYLGLPQSAYSAEAFTKAMIALVGRQFEPGLKFHNMMVLQAPQGGEGKSTFTEIMGFKEFHTDLNVDLGDNAKVVEGLQGKIIAELGEMKAYNKSESSAMKAFLSRSEEQVRVAYAKNTMEYPRQSICIGTINDGEYLKDPSGARRYWPMLVTKTKRDRIDNPAFKKEYPQIVGEAVHAYRALREEWGPDEDLPLDLTDPESIEEHERLIELVEVETPAQVLAGELDEWASVPVPLHQIGWAYRGEDTSFPDDDDDRLVYRTRSFGKEVFTQVMGRIGSPEMMTLNQINAAADQADHWNRTQEKKHFHGVGSQKELVSTFGNWSPRELKQGFAEIDSPNAPDIEADVPDMPKHDDLI